MIVVDASAVLAIFLNEPERGRFAQILDESESNLIPPVNYWEAIARARSVDGEAGATEVASLIRDLNIDVAAIGHDVAVLAVEALKRFGGRPARLNLGDCFAYALAKSRDAPLLFKGNDFVATDVAVV